LAAAVVQLDGTVFIWHMLMDFDFDGLVFNGLLTGAAARFFSFLFV
jgi:hypothetical protein